MVYNLKIIENGFDKKLVVERDHTGYTLAIVPDESQKLEDAVNVVCSSLTKTYLIPAYESQVILDLSSEPFVESSILMELKTKLEESLRLEKVDGFSEEYTILNVKHILGLKNFKNGLSRVSVQRENPQYGIILKRSENKENTVKYEQGFVTFYTDVPYDIYLIFPEDHTGSIYLPTTMAKSVYKSLQGLFLELSKLKNLIHVTQAQIKELNQIDEQNKNNELEGS